MNQLKQCIQFIFFPESISTNKLANKNSLNIINNPLVEEMKGRECIGCQTHFQKNQKLVMEGLVTQHKNYHLPIKDQKFKWIILKTITSFLNCKGGTIFIGVDDDTGSVIGIALPRKERDLFRLFMQQIIARIHPKVDLNNKEEVLVQYVPVLNQKQFEGKYVVKIIVQQGDPSKTYCLTEKIRLDGKDGKFEDYEIYHAYYRHNMGGTEQSRGLKLLDDIYNRAKNPNPEASTFHQNCNPEPPHLELTIKRIHFDNIDAQDCQQLIQIFSDQLTRMNIEGEILYSKEKRSIVMIMDQVDEFEEIKDFITQNLKFFNDAFPKFQFQEKGGVENYHLYHNSKIKKERKFNEKQEKNGKYEKNQKNEKQEKPDKLQRQISQKKEKINFNYQKKQNTKPEFRPLNPKIQQNLNGFSKKYVVTLTHIEPSTVIQLEEYLKKNVAPKLEKQILLFQNSVEVFFKSENDMQKFLHEIQGRKQNQLAGFGFKGEIKFGLNLGRLQICNYDKNQKDKLRNYLKELIGVDAKSIEFQKQGSKFSIICEIIDKRRTCLWLDSLLKDRDLKAFRIPGFHKGNVPKLKVYLQVG